jgi:uncharacterized protein involved in exopolysaccharide biosynthesis
MGDSISFLKPYLRGWPLIVFAMIIAFMGASKYLNYVTPIYESTSKLRLADTQEGVPNNNLFKDLDVFSSTQKLTAEIEVLKSNVLLSKALEKLDFGIEVCRVGKFIKKELYKDSPLLIHVLAFLPKNLDKDIQFSIDSTMQVHLKVNEARTIKSKLGDTIKWDDNEIIIELNTLFLKTKTDPQIVDSYEFVVKSEQKLLSEINKNIDVISVDKDVPVIRISFKSANPEKAADFPNALAKAYIDDYIENKFLAASITVDFLNEQISDIGNQLSKSEERIMDYRNDFSITNIRQETETDLRKISQMKIQQTNLSMSLDAIIALEDYLKNGKDNFLELAPNFEAFNDLLSTEMVKNIKALQAEKKDLLLKYTENEDRVKVIDAKIKDLTSYLQESVKNTRLNLEVKYNNLLADIKKAELVFVDVPEKEKILTILNREFEIYQQSYNFLNQKKIEADIARAAKISFHRVITPATVQKQPISPNKAIIKIVAAILGMFGAIIFIFIIHSLKAKVNSVNEIENNSNIDIIATIPKLKQQAALLFFINLMNEWEVKNVFKPGDIVVLNYYNIRDGAAYLFSNISIALKHQKTKTLLISTQQNDRFTKNEITQIEDYLWNLSIDQDDLTHLSAHRFGEWLSEKTKGFELTIVLNQPVGNVLTLPFMANANVNVMCLDARLSALKKVNETEMLADEYQLKNMFFSLNRVGYHPNIIFEVFNCVQKKLKKYKS